MKHWEPTEDLTLRRMAATSTAWQIGQALGRSQRSVWCRAQRLGVRLQKEGERRHGCRWSDAQVERARSLHDEGYGPARISRAIGVPVNAIKNFVHYRRRLRAAA